MEKIIGLVKSLLAAVLQTVGNTGRADSQEPFGNANCTGRVPLPVTLDRGWNEILLKLPVGAFSTNEYRLVKWMFTCALTTLDGRAAAEVEYSKTPDR